MLAVDHRLTGLEIGKPTSKIVFEQKNTLSQAHHRSKIFEKSDEYFYYLYCYILSHKNGAKTHLLSCFVYSGLC